MGDMMEAPRVPDLSPRYMEMWLEGKRDVEKHYLMWGGPPEITPPLTGHPADFTRYYSSKLWAEYYKQSGDLDDNQ